MRVLLRLIVCLCASTVTAAQAGAEALPDRVGWVAGAGPGVSYRGAADAWQDALADMPVATGMSLRTDAKAGAELDFAEAAIVLAPNSEIDVARYDRSGIQIALRRGEIGLRLDRLPSGVSVEVDTARGGIWLLQPGRYVLGAGDAALPTSAATLAGRARFVGGGLDRIVAAGTATLVGGGDMATFTSEAVPADPFAARWGTHPVAAADPASPLPAALPGATTLAGSGTWGHSDEFGTIWYPDNLPADWAPFRYGRWRAIAPWGWTWIDDAGWGFVPSHYGRWARTAASGGGGGRWGWIPGAAIADAAFVPATVAFLGTAGVGLSYAGGSGPAVAWFPLGPGEIYWPGYTGDLAAITRANAGIGAAPGIYQPGEDGGPPAAVVTARYRNRAFASAVPRAIFAGGKPVAPDLLSLPIRRLEIAPLLAGSAPVPPRTLTVAQHLEPAAATRPTRTLAARHSPRHAKVRVAAARPAAKPHLAASRKGRPAPSHIAAAPNRPPHGRRHVAAARHVMRQ